MRSIPHRFVLLIFPAVCIGSAAIACSRGEAIDVIRQRGRPPIPGDDDGRKLERYDPYGHASGPARP